MIFVPSGLTLRTRTRDGLLRVVSDTGPIPRLVLAHYAPHERSTIAAYANRYGMLDDPVVDYLLGDSSPLFDIQKPILESLVLPLRGYGLKDICKHPQLVDYQWQDVESDRNGQ